MSEEPALRYVYVAGKYSNGNPMHNIREALRAADRLLDAGLVPFVPHLTGVWDMVSARAYESWLAYDLQWVARCDCVLRMPGKSAGADREVACAERLGLPVFYSTDGLLRAAGCAQ